LELQPDELQIEAKAERFKERWEEHLNEH
jgi:hypothetical protein